MTIAMLTFAARFAAIAALLLVLTLIIGALFVTGPFGAQLFSQVSGLTGLGQ